MRTLCICILALVMSGAGCSGDFGLSKSENSATPGAGIGGSTARFTLLDNTLYVVNSTTLRAYDVSNSMNPIPGRQTKLGFGIETIFPYSGNLFIGTQTGMLIYDASRPGDPRYLSTYTHVLSCDPVVVQGTLAYVTLRSGADCRNNAVAANLLEVIDVSNLQAPRIIRSIPMINPRGLGVDGDVLFVCEGDSGLKMFDLTNPTAPRLMQHLEGVRSYDVIPNRDVLIVTGKDGIYQYSYADRKQLKLLSKLAIEPLA
ncbi:LVIVD repeat-containing protein [Rudanella paleaurantiibacter]|nr:hypothetical protein [Rudanella paleaurantiibacter]